MKKAFIIFLAFLPTLFCSAQDTITVMHYNLLQYGNYGSAYAGCNEASNNTQQKDEYIRDILDYVRPDILTVNEFGASQSILNSFVSHNLNINGTNYWKTSNICNLSGSSIVNCIFYNSNKLTMKKHTSIATSVRDIDFFELYFNTSSLLSNDTVKLVCVVAHLKAGTGATNESKRREMIQLAMNHIERNYPNENLLIMGDFNLYSSSESAYQLLTSTYPNSDILFMDPLGNEGVGPWNENPIYSKYHTQSTNRVSVDCKSSGGLDDRFDFILMSDEIGFGYRDLRYVTDSYWAVGNDGEHLNRAINENGNNSVPAEVATALFNNSDHLPIQMRLAVNAKLGVNDALAQSSFQGMAQPNPTKDFTNVCFYNEKAGSVSFDVYNVQGQLVKQHQE